MQTGLVPHGAWDASPMPELSEGAQLARNMAEHNVPDPDSGLNHLSGFSIASNIVANRGDPCGSSTIQNHPSQPRSHANANADHGIACKSPTIRNHPSQAGSPANITADHGIACESPTIQNHPSQAGSPANMSEDRGIACESPNIQNNPNRARTASNIRAGHGVACKSPRMSHSHPSVGFNGAFDWADALGSGRQARASSLPSISSIDAQYAMDAALERTIERLDAYAAYLRAVQPRNDVEAAVIQERLRVMAIWRAAVVSKQEPDLLQLLCLSGDAPPPYQPSWASKFVFGPDKPTTNATPLLSLRSEFLTAPAVDALNNCAKGSSHLSLGYGPQVYTSASAADLYQARRDEDNRLARERRDQNGLRSVIAQIVSWWASVKTAYTPAYSPVCVSM